MAVGSSPFPIATISGKLVQEVDASGSITAGGTAQQLMAAATAVAPRTGWWLQNQSSGTLFVVSSDRAGAATAGAPSIEIPAGALYECPNHMVSQGTYSIYGATTGQAWAAAQVVN
jgi:hypothetical protein